MYFKFKHCYQYLEIKLFIMLYNLKPKSKETLLNEEILM